MAPVVAWATITIIGSSILTRGHGNPFPGVPKWRGKDALRTGDRAGLGRAKCVYLR